MWSTRVKCMECGNRIEGQKFSRMVFGQQAWVCGTCEEKTRAKGEQARQELLRVEQEQRRLEEVARLKHEGAATASIFAHPDANIAEAMVRVVLNARQSFVLEATALGAGIASVQGYCCLAAALSWAVGKTPEAMEAAERWRRVDELFSRYAVAQYIHLILTNEPGIDNQSPSRLEMINGMTPVFRQDADVHKENFARLMEKPELLNEYLVQMATGTFFPKDYCLELRKSNKEQLARMTLCVNDVLRRVFSSVPLVGLEAARLTSPPNTRFAIDLPESWCLRQLDPYLYYDPTTPQYHLIASVYSPSPDDVSPIEFIGKVLRKTGNTAVPESIGLTRAMARWRSTIPEAGKAKDDYHWCLAHRQPNGYRLVQFTLSVEAARADKSATEELVELVSDRIARVRFLS